MGSKNFQDSRDFYSALGFEEVIIDPKMSYFKINETLGFYLQDYYVKEWVENSMIFLEIDNVVSYREEIIEKDLHLRFQEIKITKIMEEDWGIVFHLIDPAGILWHFGKFK